MHLPTLLLPVLSLTATAAAAAIVNGPPFPNNAFIVQSLTIYNSTKPGEYTISFFVKDPDPADSVTTVCGTQWTGAKDFPAAYRECKNPAVVYQLSDFKSMTDFVIGAKHTSTLPSLGGKTTYAKGPITKKDLVCKPTYCTLAPGATVTLPLYGFI
ncbi:hypothetical protein FKW77_004628 [Venturia effusa]|uniref:AA1-like domain-containing protein n=1 Tax=Venturia effusa TaxID=50376 RepID=A0A517LQ19_9PEZI|nr:hypothetical protein FKW77_004628 [Venturia effusa]